MTLTLKPRSLNEQRIRAAVAEWFATNMPDQGEATRQMVETAVVQYMDAHPAPAGARGEPGPAGETGPRGADGPQGERGATGADGPAGARGETGPPGGAGPAGERGPQGVQGERGEAGGQGPAGPDGPRGIQGERGERGAQGDMGPIGRTGETGERGPEGMRGATGNPGASGTIEIGTVTSGAPGTSVTVTNRGTPQAAILDIQIPRGMPGPSSKVSLGTITLAQNALVAITAGVRTLTLPLQGVLAGDDLTIHPVGPLPAGYAIHGIAATAANTVQVTLTAPLLAIGASYSIPCRVNALR